MGKKIIVAGAGHGGLVAAAHLARLGCECEVFEKKRRDELGYDWTDTIGRNTFDIAGFADNERGAVTLRKNSTFYAPNRKTPVEYNVSPGREALEIERKTMYDCLIAHAENAGVRIHYSAVVQGPLPDAEGGVRGLKVDGREEEADLVVDSAGLFSPVMAGLPAHYRMAEPYGENSVFHVYRGYYDLAEGADTPQMGRFNIYFKFMGIKGIAWYKVSEGMADFLVGSVEPLDPDTAQAALREMRKVHPEIGGRLLRGGRINDIPIRSTHTLLVGNRYAAVGDAVSMPDPMNGSGITNAVKAGALLAETAAGLLREGRPFDTAGLWDYQVRYYKSAAHKAAAICVLKNCLLSFSPEVLNFFFDKKILTAKELGGSGQAMKMDKAELTGKIRRGIGRPLSLLKLKKAVETSKEAKNTALAIPETYDADAVEAWRAKLNALLA
ncbi:MAG TPA: NAD(P)/FAD-dependent oxidoreductase [Clostridiales bacterium]|nr:MAG: hypothetical protein BWY37_01695 [Firmicutes bacterium ADurb.Bin262]HOU09122.1 NAD(P)/FAD-dependent oxidoreductase [Clostridiales bacterium]HQH62068.1 NAD(P)/FAD-dependent oxidoreductase [Clostridiales bacterium]HQK73776.1 NAD(P)/FAD-dependent oxidoreductase [Clostridiales bacterium]